MKQKQSLNKEEIKMFLTLYDKVIAFHKKIETNKKRDIPLIQKQAHKKTIGDMLDFMLNSCVAIGETILG